MTRKQEREGLLDPRLMRSIAEYDTLSLIYLLLTVSAPLENRGTTSSIQLLSQFLCSISMDTQEPTRSARLAV